MQYKSFPCYIDNISCHLYISFLWHYFQIKFWIFASKLHLLYVLKMLFGRAVQFAFQSWFCLSIQDRSQKIALAFLHGNSAMQREQAKNNNILFYSYTFILTNKCNVCPNLISNVISMSAAFLIIYLAENISVFLIYYKVLSVHCFGHFFLVSSINVVYLCF